MLKYYICNKQIFVIHIFKRSLSTKKNDVKKKYSNTVHLPTTSFPLWIKSDQRTKLDNEIETKCKFFELYDWQREHVNGTEFVLHDGPPYANGPLHMGHAINKILKDITNRRKLLDGYKIHYIPGWDCHGLPIESKVLHDENWNEISPVVIREKARKFAKQAIEIQKNSFKILGILANWDDSCYYTFDKNYVKNQIQQFYKLYEKNLVYRSIKPVYWSPSSRTALAEAELLYNEQHVSKSVTFRVKLNISTISQSLCYENIHNCNLYALIWTTTPWTILANEAVAYNPDFTYCVVKISGLSDVYLLSTDRVEYMEKLLGNKITVISTIPGSVLDIVQYEHPMHKGKQRSFLPANFVTTSKGTGLVHISPAHGQDDFILGIKHNLPVNSIANENGCFVDDVGNDFAGLDVLNEGSDLVINKLSEDIIHSDSITHSYPYDWRSNAPVIMRASEQWFIDSNLIKEKSVQCLENVKIIPKHTRQRLMNQILSRPYWCISRQRVWGIPIPVLYDTRSNRTIINKSIIDGYCELIDKHGTDFWWILSMEELVPKNFHKDLNFIIKGVDILDIWLDSGLSWSSVLGEKTADVYMEGIDQCTGWFQSSLMTSVALQNKSPFRALFVHGFAVDSDGRKMSKSLGNVVNPDEIIKGKSKQPPYGIDVFRWYVAAHSTQHSNIVVSDRMFLDSKECIQKLRHIFRFMLGVLNDYSPSKSTGYPLKCIFDKYMLHLLREFYLETSEMYNHFQYNKVCLTLLDFVSNTISASYCHLTKDRLYCESKNSEIRRSCQQVNYFIIEILLNVIAPINPHLAEEVYLHHPLHNSKQLYFQSIPFVPDSSWDQPEISNQMEKIFELKNRIFNLKPVELKRINVHIKAVPSTYTILQKFSGHELCELLQTSKVTFERNLDDNDKSSQIIIQDTDNSECLRCRRFTCNKDEELCNRCFEAINGNI